MANNVNISGDTVQADAHATAARLNRLLTVCHGLRWTDLGVLALDSDSTKKALLDLSELVFMDAIDEVVSGKPTTTAAPILQGVKADEKQYVDCACTKIEQDENCPVGYPSLLCEICNGKGVVPYPASEQALDSPILNFAKALLCSLDPENDLDNPEKFLAWHNLDEAIRALSSQPVAVKGEN
jgi:hypothetical protein